MTSAVAASLRNTAWPSGAFMFRVIERLLRLTKAWIVRRMLSSSLTRSGSGVSIFRTSAPMSAMIMPGISAGGTRANSRILMPSSTPMTLLLSSDEPRGERADVRDVFEVENLVGQRFRRVGTEHGRGAAEELVTELRVGQWLIRMAGGAPRRQGQQAPVTQPHGHAAPRVLLERLRQVAVDDHPHAAHQLASGGVAHRAILEARHVHAPGGQRGRRAELHGELALERVAGPRVLQHVRHHVVDADLHVVDRVGLQAMTRAQLEQRVDRRMRQRTGWVGLHGEARAHELPALTEPIER